MVLLLSIPAKKALCTTYAVLVVLFCSCSSQPAKYRHSNDCKCPKWSQAAAPANGDQQAAAHPAPAPYHCGTAQPA
ncbi:MAG: hypothetical protein IT225_01240 [Flavobacteriales bacterium]|nr:hypothetical protein [Flavobacteriales bacterium]